MNFFIEQNVLLKGGGWQYANSGKEVFRQATQSKCSEIELDCSEKLFLTLHLGVLPSVCTLHISVSSH